MGRLSIAFRLGMAVLVLDGFFVEQIGHLGGNILLFVRMWNDGELLLLRLFRLAHFRLGFFGLFCHDTLFAQGSEQSRINPQLRQISLQCTSSMGKPQTSQGSPSSSTADRSARPARTSRFNGSSKVRARQPSYRNCVVISTASIGGWFE